MRTVEFDRIPLERDALDDLAESYLAADRDLSAGRTDDAWWEQTPRGIARRRDGRRAGAPEGINGPIPVVPLQMPAQAAEPAGSARVARRPHGRLMVGATALVTVLIAGGVVALLLSSRHSNTPRVTATEAEAASWVTDQVSHNVKVSCDQLMCGELISRGFPSDDLVQIIHHSPDPLKSAIVMMTPTLQRRLGVSFGARWAPTVLAQFGDGADRITVRVIAPHGAGAYEAALSAGLSQRIFVGASLVTNSHISIVPASKRAILAGLVDPRILSVIVALAAQHPVDVLAFGKTFPGMTPGTPFRTVVFAETVPGAGLTPSRYAAFMISLLRAQSAEYRPAWIRTVRLPGGHLGLEVQYSGPSPLELLGR